MLLYFQTTYSSLVLLIYLTPKDTIKWQIVIKWTISLQKAENNFRILALYFLLYKSSSAWLYLFHFLVWHNVAIITLDPTQKCLRSTLEESFTFRDWELKLRAPQILKDWAISWELIKPLKFHVTWALREKLKCEQLREYFFGKLIKMFNISWERQIYIGLYKISSVRWVDIILKMTKAKGKLFFKTFFCSFFVA